MTAFSWHDHAWMRARAALRRGAHALLITGASGLGKGQFALELAAARLCLNDGEGKGACGACESCRWLAAGTHPDFALIERPVEEDGKGSGAASTSAREKAIGVDQVRALSEWLPFTAHREAGKVVMIRPAEAMNPAAANALLKNLEEPPPGVLFLLVSDRPALLLPTVRSRCQSIAFALRDRAVALAWLEEQGIANADLALALSGGAPLQAATIASDPAWERRKSFLAALAGGGGEPLRLAEAYRDLPPALMLSWLQRWTYDLLLMRLCRRVRYHIDFRDVITSAARSIDAIRMVRLHRTLLGFQRHVNHPLNARSFIEHMLLEYAGATSERLSP